MKEIMILLCFLLVMLIFITDLSANDQNSQKTENAELDIINVKDRDEWEENTKYILKKVAEIKGISEEEMKIYEAVLINIITAIKDSLGDKEDDRVYEAKNKALESGISEVIIEKLIEIAKLTLGLKKEVDKYLIGRSLLIGIGHYMDYIKVDSAKHGSAVYLASLGSEKIGPSIGFHSKRDYFFSGSGFGWNYVLSYLDINENLQRIPNDPYSSDADRCEDCTFINLGTSAQSKMLIFIPRLFYHFRKESRGFNVTFAVGMGLSYGTTKGDIYLTHSEVASTECLEGQKNKDIKIMKSSCEKIEFDESGFSYEDSGAIALEFQVYDAYLNISLYGGAPPYSKKDSRIGSIGGAVRQSIELGYRYQF